MYLGFDCWPDVLRWVKANSQGRRAQWTYYVSPTVNEDGKPVKVACKAIVRNIDGKAHEQIHVSPSLASHTEFEPFDATADHYRYFRRGEHTSLPARSPEAVVKPFDPWSMSEPAEGPLCTCDKCAARYRAHPFQSQRLCTACKAPSQRCMHGKTNFERCPECPGGVPSKGLASIVPARGR